jgi:hypothetical protein
MKTILTNHRGIITLMLFATAFITLGLTYTFSNDIKDPPPQQVGVDFGRGPSCSGPRGLCSVNGSDDNRSGSETHDTIGELYIGSNGELKMEISKDDISVGDAETQFVDGFFKQEDDFTLPSGLSTALMISSSPVISSGFYPVEESTTHFIINFSTNQNR